MADANNPSDYNKTTKCLILFSKTNMANPLKFKNNKMKQAQ